MRCEQCGAESEGRLCSRCSAVLTELPIPASFFTPEEAASRHSYAPPSGSAGQSGFVITAASLEIEAVSPESEAETQPLPPAESKPRRTEQSARSAEPHPADTAAAPPRTERPAGKAEPPRAASSDPIPVAEGFYLVPYDESMWATLSRIRHRWLLPIIVGVIFVAGMTTGIVMARASSKKNNPPADSAAETAPAATTAPVSDAMQSDESEALLAYFEAELLTPQGYAPDNKAVPAASADGILSVYTAGQQMTVLSIAEGELHMAVYLCEDGAVQAADDTVYADLLTDIAEMKDAVLIGDSKGIYLGGTRISEVGLGTAENTAPITLCACSIDSTKAYSFADYTGIRERVPDRTRGWLPLYTALLRDTLQSQPQDETAFFRLMEIDADASPELELHVTEDGVQVTRIYTVSDNKLLLLLTDITDEYACVPHENSFRGSVEQADGTYYYWYHIEEGAAVLDHAMWFGLQDDEWVYLVDGETFSLEDYAAQYPETEARLETDITYLELTEDAVSRLGN